MVVAFAFCSGCAVLCCCFRLRHCSVLKAVSLPLTLAPTQQGIEFLTEIELKKIVAAGWGLLIFDWIAQQVRVERALQLFGSVAGVAAAIWSCARAPFPFTPISDLLQIRALLPSFCLNSCCQRPAGSMVVARQQLRQQLTQAQFSSTQATIVIRPCAPLVHPQTRHRRPNTHTFQAARPFSRDRFFF